MTDIEVQQSGETSYQAPISPVGEATASSTESDAQVGAQDEPKRRGRPRGNGKNGNSNGHRDSASAENGTVSGAGTDAVPKRANPFVRIDHADHEWVKTDITEAVRKRFDEWFNGQYPDAARAPAKAEWVNICFQHGLDWLEEHLPAVTTLQARYEAAQKGNGNPRNRRRTA